MLCRVKLSEGTCSGLFTGAVAECLDFCKVFLTTRNGRKVPGRHRANSDCHLYVGCG